MTSYEAYAKQLERPSVAWLPHRDTEQPRSIVGRLVDTYETTSDYSDDPVPVVVIDDEEAAIEYVVKGYAAQLAGQLLRLRPQIGDIIGIGYGGRADAGDSASAHRYKVRVFERANRTTDERPGERLFAGEASPVEAEAEKPFDGEEPPELRRATTIPGSSPAAVLVPDAPDRETGLGLLEQHQRLLDASAINCGIASSRGYFSAANARALRQLGFSPVQASQVPALVIPLWNVHGHVALHQTRPDRPRVRDGKPVKYETPSGVRTALDVHPSVRRNLGDPNRPLIVTEGVRKADAAISHGVDAIALLGIWNWRGTNGDGGKSALADWEQVTLDGRNVYLAFDSDTASKPQVRSALNRLGRLLESRGATTRVCRLQPANDGGKQGLDDYLAAGGSLGELLAAAATLAEQQTDLLAYAHTDLGHASRFVAMHCGGFRHCGEEHRWLEYRHGRWRRDLTGSAERAAAETVETFWQQVLRLTGDERKAAASWALRSQSAAAIRNMLVLASTAAELAVSVDQLDRDPYLLACGNGTLDLRTGELRDPDPDDLITLGTDVDYHPGAPRERFNRFLAEIFDQDADLIAFINRFYGSALTGDTRDRVAVVEWGPRFNGKTTLNNAIQKVLGDFAHTAPIRVVMRSRQSEIPNEIAALHRKRLVIVAETASL